jgi:competence protein ComFC
LKSRGFNQAKLICQYFNKYLRLPVFDSMEKIKETGSQAEIKDKKQRSLNQKGVFDITKKKEVINNNFIIVDDVVTTGATVREICRLLKRCGAKKVYVLTLAKGS